MFSGGSEGSIGKKMVNMTLNYFPWSLHRPCKPDLYMTEAVFLVTNEPVSSQYSISFRLLFLGGS